MTIRIVVENRKNVSCPVRIELTDLTKIVQANETVKIDTDLISGDIHIQITDNGLVIWGGVDASFIDN